MSQTKEIVGIQYLRGMAALVVVIAHTGAMGRFDKYFGQDILGGFFDAGGLGVDLFFVISGFIICVIALEGPQLTPAMTLSSFAERRFARIIPMMWLAILTYAGLRLIGRGTFEFLPYLRALFLFPSGDVQPNQIWTLRHEAIFYILFAISFLSKRPKVWVLGLWFVSPIVYALLSLPTEPTTGFGQFVRIVTHPANMEFATGFFLGVLWLKRMRDFSFSTPVSPVVILAVAVAVLLVVGNALHITVKLVSQTMIVSSICGLIVFFSIHVRCPVGILDKAARVMGDASYSIYLFHPHFISAIMGVWSHFAHNTPMPLVTIGTVVLATSAALIVHLVVEKPLVAGTRTIVRHFRQRYVEPKTA